MANVLEQAEAFVSPFYYAMSLVAGGTGVLLWVRYKSFGLLGIALIVFIGSALLKVEPNTKSMVMPLFVRCLIGYSLAWIAELIFRQDIL